MDPELVKFASVGSRYIADPTIGDDQTSMDIFLKQVPSNEVDICSVGAPESVLKVEQISMMN